MESKEIILVNQAKCKRIETNYIMVSNIIEFSCLYVIVEVSCLFLLLLLFAFHTL